MDSRTRYGTILHKISISKQRTFPVRVVPNAGAGPPVCSHEIPVSKPLNTIANLFEGHFRKVRQLWETRLKVCVTLCLDQALVRSLPRRSTLSVSRIFQSMLREHSKSANSRKEDAIIKNARGCEMKVIILGQS